MEEYEVLKAKSPEEVEEWFVAGLSEDVVPVEQMLNVLRLAAEQGSAERADGWAELLIDTLIEKTAKEDALRILGLRAGWQNGGGKFRKVCVETALRIFSDRLGKALVESVGFEKDVPVKDCLQRLDTLSRLQPGVLCYDKTWKFGVVQKVDEFYKKVTIDFTEKAGHQMSFAYAAETLTLLADDHFLAFHYKESESAQELIDNNPAELIKMALRSFGPMSAPDIQAFLVSHCIIIEDKWKSMWDKARKDLKKDPLVDIPSKRTDPIRLLDKKKAYDQDWFAALRSERDIDTILRLVDELERDVDPAKADDSAKLVMRDRLAFAVKADEGSNYERLARIIMTIKRLGIDGLSVELDRNIQTFFDSNIFMKAADEMPARELDGFIKFLAGHDSDKLFGLLISGLFEMNSSMISASITYLFADGKKADVVSKIAEGFGSKNVPPAILYWLARNLDVVKDSQGLSNYELLVLITMLMELTFTGEQLRVCNQLKALFDQKQWLETVLEPLSQGQRAEVLSRVKMARVWDLSDKRSVMAKMIKMYPELESVVADHRTTSEPVKVRRMLTSLRTYKARQDQFRKLINEEIPANSKEIGVARSYGDLRENAEYDAAKQHQSILMRRKDEMEQDLTQVSATDFEGFSSDVAGMGTCVVVRRPGGEVVEYNILGEWDSDDTLGIISSRSKLAEALGGLSAGADVELPSANGSVLCSIVETRPLSDKVKAWINGLQS